MVINFTQRYIDKMTHFAQWVQESQNTLMFSTSIILERYENIEICI